MKGERSSSTSAGTVSSAQAIETGNELNLSVWQGWGSVGQDMKHYIIASIWFNQLNNIPFSFC